MKSLLTLSAILSTALIPLASAETLLEFSFAGEDLANNRPITTTTTLPENIQTSGWDFGPGVSTPGEAQNDRLAFTQSASPVDSTLQDAINDDEYLTCTFTPTEAFDLNSMRVSFSTQRIHFWSARQYSVLSSIDNFSTTLYTSTATSGSHTEVVDHSFILPSTGYGNITTPVEFRIYVHNARANGHTSTLTAFSISDPGEVFTVAATSQSDEEVSIEPISSAYTTGEVVTISATPPAGHRFSHWTGSHTSQLNPLIISMNSNVNVQAHFEKVAPVKMSIGQNLAPPTTYATAWPFADSMLLSGRWTSNANQNNPPTLNAQGMPVTVPYDDGVNPQATARRQIPNQTAGIHILSFEGSGTVGITNRGIVEQFYVTGNGGVTTHPANLDGNGRFGDRPSFRIISSDPSDPIRNVRLHMPSTDATNTFHPLYLERTQPFSVIRFMDWGQTNGSPVATWSDRTPVDNSSQAHPAAHGVALEYQIQLANTLGRHPWFCIPHLADDHYVTETARLIRDTLNDDLQIYIEYSNETWNTSPNFPQTPYTRNRGLGLPTPNQPEPGPLLSSNAWTAGHLYHSKRSAQIWQIFHDVFSEGDNPNRIVNVLAAQATIDAVAETRLNALSDPEINPTGIAPHALAIAPYFGYGMNPEYLETNGYPEVDAVVTTMSVEEIEDSRPDVQQHKLLADKHGIRLVCYEGGQHWLPANSADQDEEIIGRLIAANRDPRMGERYTDFLNMLNQEGVDLFVNFLDTQGFSNNGSWGTLERQDQPLEEAPKASAILNWIETNPVEMTSSIEAPEVSGTSENNTIAFPLHHGRLYTVETSENLQTWTPHPNYQNIWGDGSLLEVEMELIENEPTRFWRLSAPE